MKYNNEIVGNQYEIRELIIINFIEWYASEEEDREPLRQAMQLYLQQEIWVELESMLLEQVGETKVTGYHKEDENKEEIEELKEKLLLFNSDGENVELSKNIAKSFKKEQLAKIIIRLIDESWKGE